MYQTSKTLNAKENQELITAIINIVVERSNVPAKLLQDENEDLQYRSAVIGLDIIKKLHAFGLIEPGARQEQLTFNSIATRPEGGAA